MTKIVDVGDNIRSIIGAAETLRAAIATSIWESCMFLSVTAKPGTGKDWGNIYRRRRRSEKKRNYAASLVVWRGRLGFVALS